MEWEGTDARRERARPRQREEPAPAPLRGERMTPGNALAWQQAAGNQAIARTLAGRRAVQRAGDPQGMMKDHPATSGDGRKLGDDPADYTYHHIIPENILQKFWKKVSASADDSGAI